MSLPRHVPQNYILNNTIRISGTLLWNALDPTIKESATVDKFKRSIKTA